MAKWEGGKGSDPRPMKVPKSRFEENWDLIFGNKNKDVNKKLCLIATGSLTDQEVILPRAVVDLPE